MNKDEKTGMKPYITAAVAAYHIPPLLIVLFLADDSAAPLSWLLLFLLPIFDFICGFLFGVKKGFSIKLALICSLVFMPSIIMYYNSVTTPQELIRAAVATLVNTIVCFIFILASNAAGTYIKKYLIK